jgi:hypothetical protein
MVVGERHRILRRAGPLCRAHYGIRASRPAPTRAARNSPKSKTSLDLWAGPTAPPCYGASWSVSLNLLRTSITAVLLLAALVLPCCADPAPAIHYAPIENLEHVDVALIDRADHEIDMAAYVLTDWPVMQALTRAADRGEGTPIGLCLLWQAGDAFGWKGHY